MQSESPNSLKILYQGLGFRCSPAPTAYEGLVEKIYCGFPQLPSIDQLLLTYTDPEGDTIKIISTSCLQESLRFQNNPLIITIKQLSHSHSPAQPPPDLPESPLLVATLFHLHTFDISSRQHSAFPLSISPSRAIALTRTMLLLIGDHEGSAHSTWKFDTISKQLLPWAPLQEDHLFGGICRLENSVFAIGGNSSGVEKIEVNGDMWVREASLLFPRKSPSVAVYKNSILVVGGFTGEERLNSIERFEGDQWVLLNVKLPSPGTNFLVVGGGDKILVAGGFRRDLGQHMVKSYTVDLVSEAIEETAEFPFAGFISTSNGVFHNESGYFIVVDLDQNKQLIVKYDFTAQEWSREFDFDVRFSE